MRVTKISLVEVLVALNRTASPLRTLAVTQGMQPLPGACCPPPMGEGAFACSDVAPHANRSNFRSCVEGCRGGAESGACCGEEGCKGELLGRVTADGLDPTSHVKGLSMIDSVE